MSAVDLVGRTIVRCEQYSADHSTWFVLWLDDGNVIRIRDFAQLTVLRDAS